MTDPWGPPPPLPAGAPPPPLTATDLAAYLRLEQCGRYMWLRLADRRGMAVLATAGLESEEHPPLLSRAGLAFEQAVEEALAARFDTAKGLDGPALRAKLEGLGPGESFVVLQASLRGAVMGWPARGILDVVLLERDLAGTPRVWIADVKRATRARIEHRLQVVFYQEMLAGILGGGKAPGETPMGAFFEAGNPRMAVGLLHRPEREAPREGGAPEAGGAPPVEANPFGELPGVAWTGVEDGAAYRQALADLLEGGDGLIGRIGATPLDEVPFALGRKCDGCIYQGYCFTWAARRRDVALLPYMAEVEREALRAHGLTSIDALAALKELAGGPRAPSGMGGPRAPSGMGGQGGGGSGTPGGGTASHGGSGLWTPPAQRPLVARLVRTWGLRRSLDGLIHRAKRFRQRLDDPAYPALPHIPGAGYGTLPDPSKNPDLVMIHVDGERDPLHDRMYMLGALVVPYEEGRPVAARTRTVVRVTAGPPEDSEVERALFVGWVGELLPAVLEAAGKPEAPLHFVFFAAQEQGELLAGLARNFDSVLASAPPLYDLLAQRAGLDAPVATFLEDELKASRNDALTCPSLMAVAATMGFDWGDFRRRFRARLFDSLARLDDAGGDGWYARKARYHSALPVEYAYAAWGELPEDSRSAPFAGVTLGDLVAFHARRLEAIAFVAGQVRPNPETQKTPFHLPSLGSHDLRARTIADALAEFLALERHATMGAWREARALPPAERARLGEALLVRYDESDQAPEIAESNRALAEWEASDRSAKRPNVVGGRLRLRLEAPEGMTLGELLRENPYGPGDHLALYATETEDERLPVAERRKLQPTPKQLLYGERMEVLGVEVEAGAGGEPAAAWVLAQRRPPIGGQAKDGYVFSGFARPLTPDALHTLDPNPDDWFGRWLLEGVKLVQEGEPNTLFELLARPPRPAPSTPSPGQSRFLAGLDEMAALGHFPALEPSKREYVGGWGRAPLLMVQGPPGTGKSFATAWAVLARLQGAMAEGRELRVLVACKTHAATDVLLAKIVDALGQVGRWRDAHPEVFADFFDSRLLSLPLYRVAPRDLPPAGTEAIPKDDKKALKRLHGMPWAVVGATPGGGHRLLKQAKAPGGEGPFGLLVLDEASQLGLPEALLAARGLAPGAPVVVVGDHRQMPPVVRHDWAGEERRTFQAFEVFRSLFDWFRRFPGVPFVRFAESFRIHAEVAEFLRAGVYHLDGIPFRSRRTTSLAWGPEGEGFLARALDPAHPLVIVLHGEATSQVRNEVEAALLGELLEALAGPPLALDAAEGLGVVVPHRAQRALLRANHPTHAAAVDTVERFQGGERAVILVGTTESDPAYLRAAGDFLLDPRRLTVALSRAKEKLVLVAARSVFAFLSTDEATFEAAALWKRLLAEACPVVLWRGTRHGHAVEVRGARLP